MLTTNTKAFIEEQQYGKKKKKTKKKPKPKDKGKK